MTQALSGLVASAGGVARWLAGGRSRTWPAGIAPSASHDQPTASRLTSPSLHASMIASNTSASLASSSGVVRSSALSGTMFVPCPQSPDFSRSLGVTHLMREGGRTGGGGREGR